VPLIAGVDSSTTATKVEVRDLDSGQVVGGGSSPHPPTQPPRSEQPPEAWWAAFESAWHQAGDPDVAAISVAGQQHGMVALNEDRRVIRPAKLWNDTESAPEAAWLIDRLAGGRQAWAEACGLVPVEVPLDALPTRRPTCATASSPQPVAQHAQREGPLQRLDRRIFWY
jgi:xylulokinase